MKTMDVDLMLQKSLAFAGHIPAFYVCEPCHWVLQAANPNTKHPERLYCPACRQEMEYHGPQRKFTAPDDAIDVQAEDVTHPRIEAKE